MPLIMDVKGSAGFISNIRINGKPIPQYKLTDKFDNILNNILSSFK